MLLLLLETVAAVENCYCAREKKYFPVQVDGVGDMLIPPARSRVLDQKVFRNELTMGWPNPKGPHANMEVDLGTENSLGE